MNPFLDRPHEPHVFVDPTGRREGRVRLALIAAVAAATVWLACLAAGCVGFSGLPALAPLRATGLHAHAIDVVQRHATGLRPATRS